MLFECSTNYGPFPELQGRGWKDGCGYWCCGHGDDFCGYGAALDREWMTAGLRSGIGVMALGLQAGSWDSGSRGGACSQGLCMHCVA